jgi:hypothetical protein
MTEDSVTIHRATEPQPEPGWRAVEDSVESASVSYQVPRGAWESYRDAEREFHRAADVIGQCVIANEDT